jgi:hypothetical protein
MNLLGIDLHFLDQGTDDPATRRRIAGIQARAHLRSKFLDPTHHQPQPLALVLLLLHRLTLRLQVRQPLFGSIYISLKFRFLDVSVGVHLHQPRDPSLDLADELVQTPTGPSRGPSLVLPAQPPLEFLSQPLRFQQQPAHIGPHRLVQPVHADRGIAADADSPGQPVPFGPTTAVIVPFLGSALDPTPVSIAAVLAHHQARQQIPRRDGRLSGVSPMRRQPLLHRLEQSRLDDRRDGDRDLVFPRRRLLAGGPSGILGDTAAGTQPGVGRHGLDLVEAGFPHVRRVAQHTRDGGSIPNRPARAGEDAPFSQSHTHLIERTSFDTDPDKHLLHHLRLGEHDDILGRTVALLLGEVAIAVRGAAQDADPARPRREEPAAAAPLADLGPLELGDDPLDLQEQPALGTLVEIAVEEDDLQALAAQLVDQDHLKRVVAGQPVGALDVEPVDAPGGGDIAQALQAGAQQGLSPIAIVEEAEFGRGTQAVAEEAPFQEVELTGDGVVLDLLFAGDSGVEGGAEADRGGHGQAPETDDREQEFGSEELKLCSDFGFTKVCRRMGRASSKAKARVRAWDRAGAKRRRTRRPGGCRAGCRAMSVLRVGTDRSRAPPCKQ